MFLKTTHSLLHQTDQDGTLIAVSRLNDSEKLKPLAVVIKCPGTWVWQRPKYKPTDFTLNDLLQGAPIQPALEKKVFLNKYEETQKGNVAGSGEIGVVGINMKAKGQGTSRILSSLGTLLKESVIMPHFLKVSKDRKVDPQHKLITQIQRTNQQFSLVKERIFTTRDCTIHFSQLNEGSFGALLKQIYPAKVHLSKRISLHKSRDVAIEIPPNTVMAYSVSELIIKSDGQYDFAVGPDGFEADDGINQFPIQDWTEVDGLWTLTQNTESSSLSSLNKELESEKATLCALAYLPHETRLSLLNLFQEILPDQTVLSALEENLEKLRDESGRDSHTVLPDTSNKLTDKFLDLLQSDTDSTDRLSTSAHNGSLRAISYQNGQQVSPVTWKSDDTTYNGSPVKKADQKQLILTAMHMLISAAAELTTDVLVLLKTFSSDTINRLNYLVSLLTKTSQRIPFRELPFLLRNGDLPEEVEQLFVSSSITLKRDNSKMYAEIGSANKVLPLVLCIVIHGLAYLNESYETDIEI